MKQKLIALALTIIMILSLSACSKQSAEIAPTEVQMRSICEMATLECYYHNVAKFNKKGAEGFLFFKKDKNFWIEYSGIVKIGIDVSKVEFKIDGTKVDITLPEATVLSCKVDENSLTEDSYIVAKASARVDATDEVNAFKQAQEEMEEQAKNDSALLKNGTERAKLLLENYVKNIGEATGKEYTVTFHVID